MLLHYLVVLLQNVIGNPKGRGRLEIMISKCKAFDGLSYNFYISPTSIGAYFHL